MGHESAESANRHNPSGAGGYYGIKGFEEFPTRFHFIVRPAIKPTGGCSVLRVFDDIIAALSSRAAMAPMITCPP